jgi:hypothetical protein
VRHVEPRRVHVRLVTRPACVGAVRMALSALCGRLACARVREADSGYSFSRVLENFARGATCARVHAKAAGPAGD